MRSFFKRIFVLTKRNILEMIREPLSLVFTIGLPLVMDVGFYYIFHGITDQSEMKYLAPAIVVFAQSFLTLFTGLIISLDRGSAFLTRLYVSRARSYEFIIGYALAMIPVSFFQSVLFFAVGGIIDGSIFGLGMVYSVLLSVPTSLLFIGLGILLGSVCSEKSIGGVASIVITGQSVLSGMWFPTSGMGKGITAVMKALPFKNATDLMQNVLVGAGDAFGDVALPLLIVAGYTVLSFVSAAVVFGNKMRAK